jgi:hypothetical protein
VIIGKPNKNQAEGLFVLAWGAFDLLRDAVRNHRKVKEPGLSELPFRALQGLLDDLRRCS